MPDFPPRRTETPTGPPPDANKRFVLGISGASGADYACRVLEQLLLRGCEVHLTVTEFGQRLLFDERGVRKPTLDQLTPHLASSPWADDFAKRLIVHPNKDVGANIASGGHPHDGMTIVPCSSASLGKIAHGDGSNLLTRAALVTLKERRRLVLVHRETPLNLIDIESMRALTLAGAIVCPANPGLYLLPRTVDDLIDFIAGKVLDLLGVEHELKIRWGVNSV